MKLKPLTETHPHCQNTAISRLRLERVIKNHISAPLKNLNQEDSQDQAKGDGNSGQADGRLWWLRVSLDYSYSERSFFLLPLGA